MAQPRFLRRPFDTAHWSFFVALVAGWAAIILSRTCSEPPYYFELAFATLTVCVAGWSAHLGVLPITTWRRGLFVLGRTAYNLIVLFLATIVVAIPLSLGMPHYQCYTPRAKVIEMYLGGSAARSEITERFATQKALTNIGIGVHVQPGRRIAGSAVTPDGTIVMASEDPPAVLLLIPFIAEGELRWQCKGYPASVMPRSCRE